MQLTQYTPYRLQNGRSTSPVNFFDALFDDFFGPTLYPAWPRTGAERRSLQVDVYEQDNAIVIEAEMPGVTKEDIRLDVKGRRLTLAGERKRETETKDEHSFRRERHFGTFERSFNLPFEIDPEKVEATLSDGVLRLKIEKPAEQQRRQITIN